jgi:hypothetical protein
MITRISWAQTAFVFTTACLIVAVFLGAGCGNAGGNENTASNIAYSAPTNTNTMANTTELMLPEFDPVTLKTRLKNRLLIDNGSLLKPAAWTNDAWLKTSVGNFYKNNQEITQAVICDVTDKALEPYNQRLQSFARDKLHNGIKSATSCEGALKLMADATLSTEAINPQP